jgi:RNA polymerase sigma-70 factor (ECF subfamily)
MSEKNFPNEAAALARRFETERPHLRRVAYRMLGSLAEADDAVQESWLKLSRADAGEIGNLTGWLTTVVARIALDMLRARKGRREEPADPRVAEAQAGPSDNPAYERELADSVGVAMLVVLEALEPAERIAFVLHDMFDLPFDEIAPIVGRSSEAARQLASRARHRVKGAPKDSNAAADRKIVDAFLAAARNGDFEALLAALDPEVEFRGDAAAVKLGGPRQMRGSAAVAKIFSGRAQAARSALIDGVVGIMVAPQDRLLLVMEVTIREGRISDLQAIADPDHLAQLSLAAD